MGVDQPAVDGTKAGHYGIAKKLLLIDAEIATFMGAEPMQLDEAPAIEQNVETLYWVRDIVEKGAAWFTSHGRHERKGLRSFSVSGRVNKPGVVLAPAGVTARTGSTKDRLGTSPSRNDGGASAAALPHAVAAADSV